MVTLGGFEPAIAGVKGRCPDLLDDSAKFIHIESEESL